MPLCERSGGRSDAGASHPSGRRSVREASGRRGSGPAPKVGSLLVERLGECRLCLAPDGRGLELVDHAAPSRLRELVLVDDRCIAARHDADVELEVEVLWAGVESVRSGRTTSTFQPSNTPSRQ